MKSLIPAFALSAAVCAAVAVQAQPRPPRGPEAVYAVQAARDGVRVRVSSNGCTKKEDFTAMRTGPRARPVITLRRMTPDRCRSFAMGSAWLAWGYGELGVPERAAFTLANPLTAWTGPGE